MNQRFDTILKSGTVVNQGELVTPALGEPVRILETLKQ